MKLIDKVFYKVDVVACVLCSQSPFSVSLAFVVSWRVVAYIFSLVYSPDEIDPIVSEKIKQINTDYP